MAENITPFNYDTPFTPARPRKKRKNKPGLHATTNQTQPSEALHRMRQYLLQGDWMLECKQLLRESVSLLQASSPEVLCLGLGSPASSRDARAQLAFLLEACDEMSLDYSKVSAYDPVFTPEDQQLLDDLEGAAYPFDTPTIVFMPHCDLQLYENLLRENWSRERLPNLLLIANRLSEYLDK
ncbi:SRR1-domain-containing protein [Abortiporus biennis]|nr:SRR1-domain-containing protein [Abortiporus biennis]